MVGWRSLVQGFDEPDEDGTEEKNIVAWTTFGKALCEACSDGLLKAKSIPADDIGIDVTAVKAVHTFALSLCTVGSAKALGALLQNSKAELPDDLVLESYQPVATALKGLDSFKGELEKMKAISNPAGLPSLLCHLKTCETAASLLSCSLVGDEALTDLKVQLEGFSSTFRGKMALEIAPFDNMVHQLQAFITKYGPVSDAAKSWNMEPVKKYFDGDETKNEFKAFHEKLDWIEAELGHLLNFSNHRSCSEGLNQLAHQAGNTAQLLTSTQVTAQDIASIVMLSGFLLNPGELVLDTVLKHCRQKYKFHEDHLPSKLAKLVQEARDKEKAASAASETEDMSKKKVKKENKVKDKKEKSEKNEKKDKKKEKKKEK